MYEHKHECNFRHGYCDEAHCRAKMCCHFNTDNETISSAKNMFEELINSQENGVNIVKSITLDIVTSNICIIQIQNRSERNEQ